MVPLVVYQCHAVVAAVATVVKYMRLLALQGLGEFVHCAQAGYDLDPVGHGLPHQRDDRVQFAVEIQARPIRGPGHDEQYSEPTFAYYEPGYFNGWLVLPHLAVVRGNPNVRVHIGIHGQTGHHGKLGGPGNAQDHSIVVRV